MSSLLSHLSRLLISRLGLLLVSGDKRDAEILALRHQILVLQRQIDRPKFTPGDRTVLALLSQAFDRRRLNKVMLIVKPATVIGWHRRLVARHWTQPPASRTGRPPAPAELRRLVLRLDVENPNWGYGRIHGETYRLGHRLAASTVWKILRDAGREPNPNRTGPSWSEFIASQAHACGGRILRRGWSCCVLVFVDESVAWGRFDHLEVGPGRIGWARWWRPLIERPVGSVLVVMTNVVSHESFELGPVPVDGAIEEFEAD